MRQRIPWFAPLLLCSIILPAAGQPQNATTFPSITAYTLDKQKITIPSGLAGELNLLLIDFAPEQQKDVDTWMQAALALQHMNFKFHYYQLPVSGRENFVFRWWETSSMRSDDSDPETWHWTVPLFIERQKFLRDLHIPSQKQVVILLVDRQGQILWRSSGPMTPEKRAALMTAAGMH